jgi:hypothetical protein
MASGDFTPELCEQLFAVPKYTASRIVWKANGPDVLIFVATVLTEDGIGLELSGHLRRNGRYGIRWGFSLKYLGHTIRSYDMARYHKNPGGSGRVRGPHKHKFSSSKIERYAYRPDPPIAEDNPNDALMDFLKEANIELRSEYQYIIP